MEFITIHKGDFYYHRREKQTSMRNIQNIRVGMETRIKRRGGGWQLQMNIFLSLYGTLGQRCEVTHRVKKSCSRKPNSPGWSHKALHRPCNRPTSSRKYKLGFGLTQTQDSNILGWKWKGNETHSCSFMLLRDFRMWSSSVDGWVLRCYFSPPSSDAPLKALTHFWQDV